MSHSSRPLSSIPSGQRVLIANITEKSLRLRLLSFGLVPGASLTILNNRSGAVVVGNNHDRIAIGRSLAERILVHTQNP